MSQKVVHLQLKNVLRETIDSAWNRGERSTQWLRAMRST